MAEISCKHCGSLDCRGCNIYRLEQMLDAGKFDALMNKNRVIQISADFAPVVFCRNCIHYKPQQKSARWSNTTPMCSRSATIKMPPDGFCSFGVEREES